MLKKGVVMWSFGLSTNYLELLELHDVVGLLYSGGNKSRVLIAVDYAALNLNLVKYSEIFVS